MIIGLMRFSVLSQANRNNWRLSRGRTLEATAAELFEPSRLDLRLKMLNAIPMASLDGQTDRDFRLIVMASNLIPEPYMQRLREVVDRRRYAELRLVSPDEAIARVAVDAIGLHDRRQITFRLDDDDGVNRHFIEDLRAANTASNMGEIISHPHGRFIGRIGERLVLKSVRDDRSAQGLAFCSGPGATIFDVGSHVKINKPMVLLDRPDAWLRSIHVCSDSRTGFGDPPLEESAPSDMAMVGFQRLNFPIIYNIYGRSQQIAKRSTGPGTDNDIHGRSVCGSAGDRR